MSVQPERREQRKQSEDVVAVQMRDEYGPQPQRIYAVAEHLLLHPLARIDQIVLLVDIDNLRRWMSVGRRFCRCTAENGNLYHYCFAFCAAKKRSQSSAAIQPEPAATIA